jgi:hypothetical protein
MDEKIVDQILDELFSSLEDLETRSAAILLFLKDQGIATDKKLAPYLEQAGNTSNVRWRAARVRVGGLLASAMKVPEPAAEREEDKVAKNAKKDSDASANAVSEEESVKPPDKGSNESNNEPQK